MREFIRKGGDLGKNYFQIHALTSESGPAVTRKLRRGDVGKFFREAKPCLVATEACGSALLSQTKGLGARAHRDGS